MRGTPSHHLPKEMPIGQKRLQLVFSIYFQNGHTILTIRCSLSKQYLDVLLLNTYRAPTQNNLGPHSPPPPTAPHGTGTEPLASIGERVDGPLGKLSFRLHMLDLQLPAARRQSVCENLYKVPFWGMTKASYSKVSCAKFLWKPKVAFLGMTKASYLKVFFKMYFFLAWTRSSLPGLCSRLLIFCLTSRRWL